MSDETWLEISKDELKFVVSESANHIQSAFDWEKSINLMIDSAQTKEQLKEAYTREKYIWDLFVQNSLLQSIDENLIKNYIGESPKTQELGDALPGNIGSFTGWQIVKKFMGKNPECSLQKLMEADAEQIFQQAKYKP